MLFQYGQLVLGINTTTASGGTVTLTNVSKQIQALSTSGSNGETYVLPDATTMTAGQYFEFFNNAAGSMIINNNGGTTLYTVNPGSSIVVTLVSNGTSNGTWSTLSSGSGIGSGSKNYLTAYTASTSSNVPNSGNGNFESGSTSGWSLAHSSLTSNFPSTVGSGGNAFSSAGGVHGGSAANANLSLSVVSSNQLAGSYSASYSSSTATTAGDMIISNAFFIDIEDQAKIMQFSIAYKAQTNPSNGNFSGTSSNSFAVAIYDVTNNAWIMPAGVYNLVQNSGVGLATGTFQTTSNSTQYQIALYNANASSGAITLYLDDFFVGPQIVQKGPAMSDWQSYTPTFSAGWGTVTSPNFFSRRVGDSLEVLGFFTTGTLAASAATITLGSSGSNGNVNVDTTKVNVGSLVGDMGSNTAGSSTLFRWGVLAPTSSTNIVAVGIQTSSTSIMSPANGNGLSIVNGSTVSVHFLVPIAGWSSNSVQSSDTDTRVVDFVGTKSGTQAVTANVTDITVTTVKDSHAGWSGSAYTVPVSGDYIVGCQFFDNGSTTESYVVYKNGSSTSRTIGQSVGGNQGIGSSLFTGVNAGDTLSVRCTQTTTLGSTGCIYINRLSGPAVIASSESVNMAYGLAVSVNPGANANLKFDTKQFDSHNAYSTSTGNFTVPITGKYQVAVVMDNSGAGGGLLLTKNGTQVTYLTNGTNNAPNSGSALVSVNAGDTLSVQSLTSSTYIGGSPPYTNYLSIFRIGN